MTIGSKIRPEFEAYGIAKTTTEKFISCFIEMLMQRRQQEVMEGRGQKPLQAQAVVISGTTPDSCNGYNSASYQTNSNKEEEVDSSIQLDPHIPNRDYAGFAIETIKKTVKEEDSLVRQIFYAAISKDSTSPINLAVMAPTSEGKTHAIVESIKYFPEEDVWMIGSMTPKVIIRQNGVLVDGNNQPLEAKIKATTTILSGSHLVNYSQRYCLQRRVLTIGLLNDFFLFLEL
jgi:hypothetical protein